MNDSQKNNIRYISAVEILAMHDRIIDGIGGIRGVRDENLLQSAAMRPQAAFGGADMFPDLFTKAAAYLESIAALHPFSDGNKRTAITTASAFLHENGYEIILPIDEAERFVLGVAEKKLSLGEIAAWLEVRSKKFDK